MATRSTIGILNENKIVTAIYCHFDGYPSGVGDILFNHYNNEEKIRELINLGSISILGKHIKPLKKIDKCTKWDGVVYAPHSFENPNDDVTLAYARDRREDLYIQNHKSEECFYNKGEAYNYLWKDNKWFVDGEELTKEVIEKDK